MIPISAEPTRKSDSRLIVMPVCQFCDQRNAPGRKNCEKCGAELSIDPSAPAEPAMTEPEDAFEAEILRLVRNNGKIAAIKRYREETGLGLKESKEAVERLAALHNVQAAGGTGCATVLAALLVVLSLATAGILAGIGSW